MAANINQVILLGQIGKDPEVKHSPNGLCIVDFSLATTQKSKDKEYTHWHRCVAFGKLAEIIADFVRKGDKILVQGSIRYEQYEKDGQTRAITKIIVADITLLSSKDKVQSRETRIDISTTKEINAQDNWGDNSFHDDEIPF